MVCCTLRETTAVFLALWSALAAVPMQPTSKLHWAAFESCASLVRSLVAGLAPRGSGGETHAVAPNALLSKHFALVLLLQHAGSDEMDGATATEGGGARATEHLEDFTHPSGGIQFHWLLEDVVVDLIDHGRRFSNALFPSLLTVLHPVVGVSRLSSWRLDSRGALNHPLMFPITGKDELGRTMNEPYGVQLALATRVLSQCLTYGLMPVVGLLGNQVSLGPIVRGACSMLTYPYCALFTVVHGTPDSLSITGGFTSFLAGT